MSRSRRQRDKSMQCWSRKTADKDKVVGAGIGNDFTDGHRGMARAVRGAKKYVNSRVRFHEKQSIRNERWMSEYS